MKILFTNLNNTQINYSKNKKLHNDVDCRLYDTICFKGIGRKNMQYYYQMILKEYKPTTSEINFLKAFEELTLQAEKKQAETFQENSQAFAKSYLNLINNIFEEKIHNADKLKLVFCTLLEGLDNAKTKENSSLFRSYLFDDFLETFSDNKDLKQATRFFIDSNVLKRTILKDLLKEY